jgi:Flp pilus assembly protein TadD
MPDLFRKAASLLQEGKFEDAEKICRQLMAMDQDSDILLRFHGATLAMQQRWKEAEGAFVSALKLDSSNSDTHRLLGAARMAMQEFDQAEDSFRTAIRLKDDPNAWIGLAFSFMNRNRLDEAREALVNATKSNEKHPLAWGLLSTVLIQSEQAVDAENAIRQAIDLAGTSGNWRQLGQILAHQKRWREAEDAFMKAIELDQSSADAWTHLSRVRIVMHRIVEAEVAIRRGIDLEPNSSYLWGALGYVLMVQDHVAEAEAPLRKATELDPQDPLPLETLGYVLEMLGPPERAEAFWAEALQIHGDELSECSVHWMALRLARGVDPDIILRDAEEWLTRSKDKPDTIAAIAKFVADSELEKGLPLAERWAKQAFEKQKDFNTSEALSAVLAKMEKWQDALAVSGPMLDESAEEEQARETTTDFIIQAAAAGWAKEAYDTLKSSKGAGALEPLMIGLQIYLGEAPVVAKEIYEIGSDVADRIRKHAEEASEPAVQ